MASNPILPSGTPSSSPVPSPGAAEPGYQTTEFWLSTVVAFFGLLESFGVIHVSDAQHQQIIGMLGMVVPAAFYAISRAIRKNGTPA